MLSTQLEELHKRLWRTFKLLSFKLAVAFFGLILKTPSKCMYRALDTVLDTGPYLLSAIENLLAAPDTLTVLSYLFVTLLDLAFLFARFCGFIMCSTVYSIIDATIFICRAVTQ